MNKFILEIILKRIIYFQNNIKTYIFFYLYCFYSEQLLMKYYFKIFFSTSRASENSTRTRLSFIFQAIRFGLPYQALQFLFLVFWKKWADLIPVSINRSHHRSCVGVEANAVFMNTVEVEIMYFKKLILFYLNIFYIIFIYWY